jgi:hypothetical protein
VLEVDGDGINDNGTSTSSTSRAMTSDTSSGMLQGQDQESEDEEEPSTEEPQDTYSIADSEEAKTVAAAEVLASPLRSVSTMQSTVSPPLLSKAGKSSGSHPCPRARRGRGRASLDQLKFDSLAALGSVNDIAMMSIPVRSFRPRRVLLDVTDDYFYHDYLSRDYHAAPNTFA